ncbi:hypothetical protein HaLaN_01820, partial [Haematococcus lacustris]
MNAADQQLAASAQGLPQVAGHLHPALQLFRKPGAAGSGSGAGW